MFSLALCGSLLFAGTAPVYAQHAGGFHGGGFHGGGFHGGGFRGGFHGGGFRGGFGWRGAGFWGPWGWGWGGLGLGLYFASLPYYYQTYWWGGVPYYYSDYTYYRWDPAMGQYATVAPPAEAYQSGPPAGAPAGAPGAAPMNSELIAYPKNGQSQEQQSKDKYECHHWAAGQTGFDPSQGAAAGPASRRSDYQRAQAACLEGRGYSVR